MPSVTDVEHWSQILPACKEKQEEEQLVATVKAIMRYNQRPTPTVALPAVILFFLSLGACRRRTAVGPKVA